MNNKARLIATSGICGAVASICLLLTSVFPYGTLMLAVVAAIAVVIPLLIDVRNLVYSLLVYLVTVVVGALSGTFIGNVVFVAPVITFCIPLAIVKVYGEQRLSAVVKWILYYALLEVGIGLTLLATYYITAPVFDRLYSTGWLFWFMIGVAQLVVPMYDLLLRGCIIGATKALRKVIK